MKRPLNLNLAIGAGLCLFTAALGWALPPGTAVHLLAIPAQVLVVLLPAAVTVILIVFGDDLERRLVTRSVAEGERDRDGTGGAKQALFTREALLPCFLIAGLWVTGYVSLETIQIAVPGKLDIIFLILTFAVIAHGIKHSGYFKYSAFRVLEVCDGRVTRMTLYLFILSSALTFVTSNDIVILVMTPIILELCRQARIRNARILLISQFIAANTLSMGLLIGSPTNIIVASEIGLDFLQYLALMFVPSILAVGAGFLALQAINAFSQRWVKTLKHSPAYSMPALKEQLPFTNEMRGWIVGFVVLLIGVSIISHYNLAFFWVTAPAAAVALGTLWKLGKSELEAEEGGRSAASSGLQDTEAQGNTKASRRSPLAACLHGLPYQIFFFAIGFFILAEALASHLNFGEIIAWFGGPDPWGNSLATMGGFGLLVNVINDLPAAAIAGKVAEQTTLLGPLDGRIFLQSMLVALNIGCYVTPVGALAGIIWFHIMSGEKNVDTPSRLQMVAVGLVHFLMVILALSILIPFVNLLRDWLFSVQSTIDAQTGWLLLLGGGMALMLLLSLSLLLRNQSIRLLDLRAFLSAASWVNVRSRKSGIAMQITISVLVLAGFMWAIWYAEGDPRESSGRIRSVGDFIVWSIAFLGSGFEDKWFPQLPIAKIVAGSMPLFAIFLIVRTFQAVRDSSSLERVSRRIARGEINTRRSVVVEYHPYMRPFVRNIWKQGGTLGMFQTILYTHHAPPRKWNEERDFADICYEKISLDNYENLAIAVEDYRLHRCDEVYLLGETFSGESGRPWVSEFAIALRNALNPPDKEEMDEDTARSMQERFDAIVKGQDPEEEASRLPRIFIWDDAEPGADVIGKEMHRLLITLPAQWRKSGQDATRRHELARKLVDAISHTAHEKSWRRRRERILQMIHGLGDAR